MAVRIEKFSTVAAVGTSNAIVPHNFLDGQVLRVALYVPDGHAGFTSWRFFFNDAQLVPYTLGATVTANDREFEWDLEQAPVGQGYNSHVSNSDVYPHSFHVEIWLDDVGSDVVDNPLPILVVPYTT